MINEIGSIESKNIEIKKFKVQGLDLIVTKPDGSIEVIKNGLSEIILGNMSLSTEQGTILSQDEILSSITLNVGADAVYIKEQFTSDTVEFADSQNMSNNNDEGVNEQKVFGDKLAELNQQNQKLEQTLHMLSSEKAEQEALLSSSLTKLTEVKKQLNQKSEKQNQDTSNDISFSSPSVLTTTQGNSSSSSSSSQPANNSPITPLIVNPKIQAFIRGELSEESGKKNDNISSTSTPTFIGIVSPDSQAHLSINGVKYPIKADKDGNWSLKMIHPLKDDLYEYTLMASNGVDKPVTVSGKFTVDTRLDSLFVCLDEHSDSGVLGDKLTNNKLPTFSGKTEAGSRVTLTIAGQTLQTITDTQGIWRISVEKPLVDGEAIYQVTATDVAGNSKTLTESVQIKTTLLPTTLQLNGRPDFLTHQTTPTLSGHSEAHADIQITIGGQVYSTIADEKGNWSIDIQTPLGQGAHSLKVKITDKAGNSETLSETVQIDTVLPAAEATLAQNSDSGVKGDHLTQEKAVTLVGKTKPGSAAVVEFAGQEYPVVVGKDGAWQVTLPAVTEDKVYDYQVKVTDKAGNVGVFHGQFTVDTQVDALSVHLDAASDSGMIGDRVTNDMRPHFSGKAEANSAIVLIIGGQKLTTTADENGDWTAVSQKGLADDLYHYQVTATDVAGNSKTLTESVQIKTTLLPTTLQLNGRPDFLTHQTTPTLSGHSEAHTDIQITIGGQVYSTIADEKGNWSIDIQTPLGQGAHSLKVKITDKAGNSETLSETVQIDTVLPAAEATLAQNSDSGVKGDHLTQEKAVTLVGKTKPGSAAVVVFTGQEYPVVVGKDGAWQVTLPAVTEDKVYDYQVRVTDNAGNVGVFHGQFTVDTQVDALSVRLDVASDSGMIGDNVTNDMRPHFSGKAEANSAIVLIIGGQKLTTTADENGDWTAVSQKGLADDLYHYQVTATDVAGNSKTLTESVQIKTTLLPTTLQLNGLPDFLTHQTTPILSGHSEAHADIQITIGGQVYSTIADEKGNWSIDIQTPLGQGAHSLKVKITDKAGNSETLSETVQIDTVLPAAEATLAQNSDSGVKGDHLTQEKVVTLVGKTKPGSAAVVEFAGQEYPVVVGKDGAWQVTLPAVTEDKVYDYQVKVTDNAGNVGVFHGQFTVDTQITLTASLDLASQENSNASITQLKRPQISGTADPDSKIIAEFKGQIKTVYTDNQGKWSLSFDVDAEVGKENNYKIVAKDAAGNQKTVEQSFSYLPSSGGAGEAHPPMLSVVLDVGSDSGKLGDYITNIKMPKFTGTATKDAKITLSINGEDFTTVADSLTGNWDITVNEQPEGNNHYVVMAEHPTNGQLKEISGNIFIDNIAPVSSIELTAETDTGSKGNFITAHQKPVFTGKGEPGCKVTLHLNNELVSTTTDSNGVWSLTLPNELPKDFTGNFKINVTDAASNIFERTAKLVISSHKPELSDIDLINPSNLGKFNKAKSINSLTPTFRGKINDDSSLEFKFSYSYQNKKQNYLFPITKIDKDGNWSFTIPEGIFDNDRRYDVDNISVVATSSSGVSSEKAFYKPGLQIKNCILKITGEVSAESSSTGENNERLSSSRSPYLQGSIEGSSDRDELKGTIYIGGKTYSVDFGKSRKSWHFKVPDNVQLPLGEVPYTLTFKDVYGSVREASFSVVISDFKFYLDPDTDSGEVGNNFTNHKHPVYKGQITAGGTISAKVNGKDYSIQANEKGEWRFEVPISGDGAYHISFIQDDGSLAVAQTTLNILTTDPVFNDFHIVDKQLYSGTQVSNVINPQLVFTYSGNMDYYLITVNGKTTRHNKLQTKYNGSKTTFANELTLSNGEHTAKITAFDVAGNKTEHKVIIKVLSDEQGITSPNIEFGINDKQCISTKDGKLLFNQNEIKFTGITTSAGQITLKDMTGKTIGTTKADNKGSWELTLPNNIVPIDIKDGNNISLSITAKDLIGRETQFDFDLLYDVTPPEITATLDDLLSNSGVININQPTFSGITKANATVWLTISKQKYSAIADANGKWKIKLDDKQELNDGTYKYEIEAHDILGQISLNKLSGDFTVKTIASINGELDPDSDSGEKKDNHTNVNKPVFKGVTEPNATVRLVFNNKMASTYESIANERGEWSINVDTELSDGIHDYVIFAIDNIQGINGKIKGQLTIDMTAPDLLIGGAVDPTDFTTKQDILARITTPTFAGIAEPDAYLEITVGQDIYKGILVDKHGNWSFTLSEPLIDGEHDYQIRITDIAGNLGIESLTGKVTIDTKAPELSGSLENSTNSGDKSDDITNINTPKFSGITEPDALVELKIANATYQGKADKSGKWTISVTDTLIDKTHDYHIEVKDAAGNTKEMTGQITIDTKAPKLSGSLENSTNSGDKSDDITNINTPKFSGITEPDALVELKIANATYQGKADESGKWIIPVTKLLADGSHKYTIEVKDKADNKEIIVGKITIDSTLPDASVSPAPVPVENKVVMPIDIPPVDNTISQIDIDNLYF